MKFKPGGKRYDLEMFMSDEENLRMAESHKALYAANLAILVSSSMLSIACIVMLTHFAHPLILKIDSWQRILPLSFASLLSLLLLMKFQKRKAQETMRTLMIRAAFKARRSDEQ